MTSLQRVRLPVRAYSWFEINGPVLFLVGLLALTLFLSLRDYFSYQFGYTPDSVEYTLLAHALVKGPLFALNYSTVQPESTHYPFGYPMLLIPFVLTAPRAFSLPALISLGATLVSVAILFSGWRTLVPEVDARWRYPVSAMFALAPTTLIQTRLVLSEAVFTTFLLLALFLTARVIRQPARRSLWFALGIAIFFMLFTRSIGIVPLGAILFCLAIRLGMRALPGILLLTATFVLLLTPVLALTPVTPANLLPEDYLHWYIFLGPVHGLSGGRSQSPYSAPTAGPDSQTGDPGSGLSLDTDYIVTHVNEDLRRMLLLSGGGELETQVAQKIGAPWLSTLPALLALACLLIGTAAWVLPRWRSLPSTVSVFFLSGLAYFLVVMLWRGSGERLWYPIQPQLYLGFGLGLVVVFRGLGRGLARIVRLPALPRAAATAVGLIFAAWFGLALYRDLTLRPSIEMWGNLDARGAAVTQYLPQGQKVLSDWPAYDFLYSGQEMSQISVFSSMGELASFLRGNHIGAIVLATDETFSRLGNTRRGARTKDNAAFYENLFKLGLLTRVYSDPFPFQIFLVNDKPS